MSNPTFKHGAITFPAGEALEKFRLVTVGKDGAVKLAGATGAIFGVVTEKADPAVTTLPTNVAVHYGTAGVKIEVDGDATAIKAGAPVYAAAKGKCAASGTVQVGVAARDGVGTTVVTVVNKLPVAAGAGEGA